MPRKKNAFPASVSISACTAYHLYLALFVLRLYALKNKKKKSKNKPHSRVSCRLHVNSELKLSSVYLDQSSVFSWCCFWSLQWTPSVCSVTVVEQLLFSKFVVPFSDAEAFYRVSPGGAEMYFRSRRLAVASSIACLWPPVSKAVSIQLPLLHSLYQSAVLFTNHLLSRTHHVEYIWTCTNQWLEPIDWLDQFTCNCAQGLSRGWWQSRGWHLKLAVTQAVIIHFTEWKNKKG